MSFDDAIDREIVRIVEELKWDVSLSLNEIWFGSAYGPWVYNPFVGLARIVDESGW